MGCEQLVFVKLRSLDKVLLLITHAPWLKYKFVFLTDLI